MIRLSLIEDIVNDMYYNYKVVFSEQVDELWYNIVKVAYFSNYDDAVDAAQVWENYQ